MTIANESGNTGPAFHSLLGDLLENILKFADNPGDCATQATSQIRELIGVHLVALVSAVEEGAGPALQSVCPPRLEAEWNRPEIQRFVAAAAAWPAPRFIDPASDPAGRELSAAGIGPSFVIPLSVGADRVGLLVLLGLMDTTGVAAILEAMTRIASVIALIIRNSFLYKNLERAVAAKTRELALHARIAAIFATVPDDEMFSEVLQVVLEVMHSPFGVFGYIDQDGAWVVPTLTRQVWESCRISEETIRFPRESWGNSTWARTIRERRTIFSNEPSTDMPQGHVGIRRHISLPIILQGEVIGLFLVANKEADYTQAALRSLEAIASHVAPLLDARLQRLRAEEALLRSARLLAETERVGKVGGWELDIDTGRQTWTEETYRIHEVDHAFEPTVENGIGFYAPSSRAIIAEAVRRAVEQGEPFDVELEIVTAKGNHRDVHTIGRADLEHRRVHGFFQDITERSRLAEEKARLEDQLRQSQKVEAIGRLAGGVAHDFNNLTAIILGYGGILLEQLPPEDPRRRHVEQIVTAGERSAALTRQLLAFSRKQTMQPEVLDLNVLLRDFEQLLGRLIGEDIELKFRLAADPGRIKADPGQIEQVITNLALNARDAMPLGGSLLIETADVELDEMYTARHESVVPGQYVMLALTDTGCGMDRAAMARLFEPFFTTKPKGKGTGLGLATVYGIVKQSGGYIWAYSEPDRGTTFKIYLPRTEAPLVPKASGGREASPQGCGELILLVEDEPSLRELCETVLVRLGYRVSAADNGLEALARVEEQGLRPDLVLTDVIMPGMCGAEMAKRLGSERPGLKVLYMSGYPDDVIAPHGILDPGTPFIQKPFSEHALATKVRELLKGDPAVAPPGRSVLMIDDDEQFRELVRHYCTKLGLRFAGVDSEDRALAALAGGSFDVLLVDLNIPGTSGENVLRAIRAAGRTAPAIVITGDVSSADMAALLPLGVAQTVEKSGDTGPLLDAIERAAARNDPQQESGAPPGVSPP